VQKFLDGEGSVIARQAGPGDREGNGIADFESISPARNDESCGDALELFLR
jgi:hypothetical protein